MVSKHARRGFVFLLFLVLTATMGFAEGAQELPVSRAKNVILLIADGCAAGTYTLGRWYKGAPLATDAIYSGAVKTHNFDSVIPDSAAAASTYATGVRTYRATGLVCTVGFTSATPAAFMAHAMDRDMDDPIAEQGVYSGLDVYLGGGRRTLTVESDEGQREDGENLLNVLQQKGYQIVETGEEMKRLKSGKVFGLFHRKYFWPEVDRAEYNPTVPHIADMTAKAIELLSQDPEGFFLMVEGSQIDWGNHENDPINTIAAEVIASGELPDADEDYQGLGEVYAKYYTEADFVTHGHAGNDVPLHAYGPGKPVGLLDV